jgi:hypothetical protein
MAEVRLQGPRVGVLVGKLQACRNMCGWALKPTLADAPPRPVGQVFTRPAARATLAKSEGTTILSHRR